MCELAWQVCITLYWLGQTIAELEDYSGPQLDLDAFKRIMTGSSAVHVSESPSTKGNNVSYQILHILSEH